MLQSQSGFYSLGKLTTLAGGTSPDVFADSAGQIFAPPVDETDNFLDPATPPQIKHGINPFAVQLLAPDAYALIHEFARRSESSQIHDTGLNPEDFHSVPLVIINSLKIPDEILVDSLRKLNREELNTRVLQLSLSHLFNGWFGAYGHEAVVHFLTFERLSDLDLPARTAVVNALQRGSNSAKRQQALARVLIATHGMELTRLKHAIDAGRDARDFFNLVYRFVSDLDLRAVILTHVADEARQNPVTRPIILSDIDDTFLSWQDMRYPPHIMYPGALAFYAGLDIGNDRKPDLADHLVFLSARINDFMGLMRSWTMGILSKTGLGDSVLLMGHLTFGFGSRRLVAVKHENFVKYQRLYPEYHFLLVGDSGQGDAIFCNQVRDEFPQEVPLAFIHDVKENPQELRDAYAANGVHFVDTYVGAALIAYKAGLMSKDILVYETQVAVTEFDKVKFKSAEQREHMEYLLRRDVTAVGKALATTL